MKKLLKLSTLGLLLLVVACSSTKKEELGDAEEHEELQRDYIVRNASSKFRPTWIEDAEIWAKEYGKDVKAYRFFSFETEPKVNRNIACNIAKANARADIAGEISTFIDKSLGTSQEGVAGIDENNPNTKALREYVENTLAEKVQALIHGASVNKTYWEKRDYKQKMGAKRDYKAYVCAVLIRMDAKRLARAIDEAADHVVKQADSTIQDNVKNALNNASSNFDKARRGEL